MLYEKLENSDKFRNKVIVRQKERKRRRTCCCPSCQLSHRKRRGARQAQLGDDNSATKKCNWMKIVNPCFCCYVDCCPLRVFLLLIAAIRIAQHLSIYIWHTFRLERVFVEHYITLELESGDLRPTANFELWWHCLTMVLCILEICLYTRLFCGALLIFPQMGWHWFYFCWALSLGGITLSLLVMWYFKEVHYTESLWTIISRALVFYEMWLWAFFSKQIRIHGNTYKGKKSMMPKIRPSVNPRIFDENHKLPFEPYHAWDDNSYSLAEEFLLANSKFTTPLRRPRKVHTKAELKKRMTGLTTQELDAAIDELPH